MGVHYSGKSNLKEDYSRNKLRLNIIPQLEELFPAFKNNIANNIYRMIEVNEIYLQQIKNYKKKLIEQEKIEASNLLKDVFNEAKSMGFDVKIIKHVIKLRKKDKDALAEEDSLIDLYRGALGV